jgi:DNA-binding transcriptional LysR family regulator
MTDINAIDLSLLKIFDALYREKHVSRAATRLRLTQPAVSMGLARLRELTGDELFVRASRTMIPTTKALHLGPIIAEALANITIALNPNQGFVPANAAADIRISVDDYLAQVIVMPAIQTAARLAPNLRFEIVTLRDRDPNAALQGDVDFAIRALQKVSEGLYLKKLTSESFKVLAAKSNSKIASELTLKTYTESEHVIASPFGGFNGIVDDILAGKGLKRVARFSVGHFSLGPLFIQDSDYLLTLPESLAKIYETQFNLACVEPPISLPSFDVNLYWHERVHRSPLHVWLRRLFEAHK